MKRFALPTLTVVALTLTLALSACSKPVTPLSASSAGGIAGLQASSDNAFLGMLQPSQSFAPLSVKPVGVTTAGISPQIAGPCSTASGWSTNADADLAPKSASIVYQDCSGGSINASGTFTIQDNDDTTAWSGFDAALTGFQVTIIGTASSTLSADATLSVNRTSAPPNPGYDITFSLDESLSSPTVNGTLHVSGQPTLASTVTSGDPYHTGTYTLNGAATFDVNGYHYSLTRTGTGIVGPGCSGFTIDTSTTPARVSDITYLDGPGNKLEFVYSGCETGTWTFTPAGGGTSSTGPF